MPATMPAAWQNQDQQWKSGSRRQYLMLAGPGLALRLHLVESDQQVRPAAMHKGSGVLHTQQALHAAHPGHLGSQAGHVNWQQPAARGWGDRRGAAVGQASTAAGR